MLAKLRNRIAAHFFPTEENLSNRLRDLITPDSVKYLNSETNNACLLMTSIHGSIGVGKSKILLLLTQQRQAGASGDCSNLFKSDIDALKGLKLKVENSLFLSDQLMKVFRAYHDVVLNNIEQALRADVTS